MKCQNLYPNMLSGASFLDSFGMLMLSRSYIGQTYRYGFDGMEKTDEIYGEGNEYTTEFRQYDPRLGRWQSLDPERGILTWQSPYLSMDNNPIILIDPQGDIANPKQNENVYEKKEQKTEQSPGPFAQWLKRFLIDYCRPFEHNYKSTRKLKNWWDSYVKKHVKEIKTIRYKDIEVKPYKTERGKDEVVTATYNLNPNKTYEIKYDMHNKPDDLGYQTNDGTTDNTGIVKNTGVLDIPNGTTKVVITVTPGPDKPTVFKFKVIEATTQKKIVTTKGYVFFNLIRVYKTKTISNDDR